MGVDRDLLVPVRMVTSPRVAIVSDTVDDLNGIALGLRRFVRASARAGHRAILIGPPAPAAPAIVDDAPIARVAAAMQATLPFYAQMTWSVPALPAMVAVLRDVDLVQLATPGPTGIAGLIAARMLGLPVLAQYHTEVAEYAARMTGLPFVRDLVQPVVAWFYREADRCLAPSAAVRARLEALGVAPDRIAPIRRGVDLARFDPARRSDAMRARLRGDATPGPIALYVGRLSVEKNLDTLLAAWAHVHAARPDARLAIVGEGPRPIASDPARGVVALGVLHGDELGAAFASADVFAFPSETETFANVVVEAAASGLPAVVARAGAAHEHVRDDTGIACDGRDARAFADAIVALFADDVRRARTSLAARAHARRYDLDAAVADTWALYGDHARALGAAS